MSLGQITSNFLLRTMYLTILFLLAIPTQLTKDKKNFLMPYHKQKQKEIHHVITLLHYTRTY